MTDIKFISINELYYRIKQKPIFKNVNFHLCKNKSTFLIGPNGCGKTTLSKLIMGIIKADAGSVKIGGVDVEDVSLSDIGREIGYLFQNPDKQLFNPIVKEELKFHNKYRKKIKYDVNIDVINLLGLNKLLDSKTIYLSEGEKRRVALACVLQLNPQYLILDEPTISLDYENRRKLISILKELQENYAIGSLIISHDKKFVDEVADRVLAIEDMRVVDVNE